MKFKLTLCIGVVLISSCQFSNNHSNKKELVLTLGAYTVPKEVYHKELIPAFQEYWLKEKGQHVKFEESYMASGAQSRAISAGFEADIAALSLEKDIDCLVEKGLIVHDWKKSKYNGFVTRSVVVIVFREGNPKRIKDWIDLTDKNVSVVYPSPKTSGGAMWDICAIYGAGLMESERKTGKKDYDYARDLLKSIQKNVKVMDKSGRASVTTFENGIGDALITYENEAILRQKSGRRMNYIIPRSTILIENPIAVIDKNVDKHKNREVANAFVAFALSFESQKTFARYGFRPVDDQCAKEFIMQYPVPENLFGIGYLGGWDTVYKTVFGMDGIWNEIISELANEK